MTFITDLKRLKDMMEKLESRLGQQCPPKLANRVLELLDICMVDKKQDNAVQSMNIVKGKKHNDSTHLYNDFIKTLDDLNNNRYQSKDAQSIETLTAEEKGIITRLTMKLGIPFEVPITERKRFLEVDKWIEPVRVKEQLRIDIRDKQFNDDVHMINYLISASKKYFINGVRGKGFVEDRVDVLTRRIEKGLWTDPKELDDWTREIETLEKRREEKELHSSVNKVKVAAEQNNRTEEERKEFSNKYIKVMLENCKKGKDYIDSTKQNSVNEGSILDKDINFFIERNKEYKEERRNRELIYKDNEENIWINLKQMALKNAKECRERKQGKKRTFKNGVMYEEEI